MEIAGRRLILWEEAWPDKVGALFRWLTLEEWNYDGEPDAPSMPVSRQEWRERLA